MCNQVHGRDGRGEKDRRSSTPPLIEWDSKLSKKSAEAGMKKSAEVDTEDMYFGLGFSHRFTSPILLYIVGKMTGIDSSCSDIHRTPKEWTSWLGINYNSFNLAWNGKTIKIELHEPNVFRDGGNFLPPFSFSGVCSKFANMVIMMMMIIN